MAERSATGGRLGSRQKKSLAGEAGRGKIIRGALASSRLSTELECAFSTGNRQSDHSSRSRCGCRQFVVKAELPASCCRSGRKAREATRRAYVMVSETNEHVLGFDTPVAGKGRFNTATERGSCDGLSVYSRAGYEHERYSTSRDRLRDNDRYPRALSVTATR